MEASSLSSALYGTAIYYLFYILRILLFYYRLLTLIHRIFVYYCLTIGYSHSPQLSLSTHTHSPQSLSTHTPSLTALSATLMSSILAVVRVARSVVAECCAGSGGWCVWSLQLCSSSMGSCLYHNGNVFYSDNVGATALMRTVIIEVIYVEMKTAVKSYFYVLTN